MATATDFEVHRNRAARPAFNAHTVGRRSGESKPRRKNYMASNFANVPKRSRGN
jgi:hypothetical protein